MDRPTPAAAGPQKSAGPQESAGPQDSAGGLEESGPAMTGAAPRLYERARRILAARIAEGALAPGSRLLESHVAEQFGISRAPARQALERLAAQGLLERGEGHGYRVVAAAASAVRTAAGDGGEAPVHLAAEPTWARIYKEVEQEIVARTGFCAWRVVENHLAAFYGVSRTVAREVVARLQQRGIVKKDGRLRWYAPALTPGYVGELYEMRALLEPVALAGAAGHLPEGAVAALTGNLEAALARAADLEGPDLSALETELHVALLGHCGNRTLMEAVTYYQSMLVAHTFLYRWAPRFYATEPFLEEHLTVAHPLAAGRVTEAGEALRVHLRNSHDRAVHRIAVVRRDFRPAPLPYLEAL
ncbi:GntR family transcriptional regulator [Aquabacter spiritensis]|uniref:GntR family transcriptional regulator n=1 Tax=Aquabacter spiritensis TaxID=933073 RepID=A0A4R3M3C4_9HYPH|nr:GntR family transcriptional regulator [Aquabacter spiritensis]TCT07734.1 GntR family transcriptional regulator [Aquabacter spiritensis]